MTHNHMILNTYLIFILLKQCMISIATSDGIDECKFGILNPVIKYIVGPPYCRLANFVIRNL